MAYRFKASEAVDDALRRIAREQADAAVEDCARDDANLAVHEVRKRCKKLRALVRLVGPGFDHADAENAAYRDTARLLSGSRDAAVRLGAFEKLVTHEQLDPAGLAWVRERLELDREATATHGGDTRQHLDAARGRLLTARGRIAAWELDDTGFEALRDGLRRAYKRARLHLAVAAANPTSEVLHTWRKRVKDHGYHCRLLRNVWREPMAARAAAAGMLGDRLGEEHDLALLAVHLRELGTDNAVCALLDALDLRRAALRREAFALGRRLFAEKPGAFTARIEAYWDVWRG